MSDKEKFDKPSVIDKEIYKIFMKLKVKCLNDVNLTNIHSLITFAMHQLNKRHALGPIKKEACINLIMLLVQDCACEPVKDIVTPEFISDVIEVIYHEGTHRYSASSKCIVM